MYQTIRSILLTLLLGLVFLAFWSCRDDGFDVDPDIRLSFSTDTLLFDTVFTSLGSSTRAFKVYNNHNRRIQLNEVSLTGGASSFFRINVDGRTGTTIRNIPMEAGDSLFVFVEVTVDPVNQNLPLIISDSVVFQTNGNVQDVKLVAWGQDARFIHPNYTTADGLSYHLIDQNTIWDAQLPYVVYGLAVVAPGVSLEMAEGTQVHFHNNSSLIFLQESSLKIFGSQELPVSIQGDRLEPFYRNQPGQWGRIWLTAGSKDHEIHHAVIKNGTVGLQVDTLGSLTDPTLVLKNTVVKNMSMVGLFAQGSHVEAENLAISNCGQYAVLLALGGTYDFRHLTIANYFVQDARQTPSVLLNNYYEDGDGNLQRRAFERVYFGNSIVYGNLQDEIGFDLYEGSSSKAVFDHCIIRSRLPQSHPGFIQVWLNNDPLFMDNAVHDFRLGEESPAIGAGDPSIALQVPTDLFGRDRTQRPDLGAVQFEPPEEDD